MTLEKENTIVFTTNDVDQAQEIARRANIDLAILDYMMPKLMGDQLARQLIDIDPEIKIIFVSGYNEVVDVAENLVFNVYGVFMKPFDPNVLEKMVGPDDYADPIQGSLDIHTTNLFSNI